MLLFLESMIKLFEFRTEFLLPNLNKFNLYLWLRIITKVLQKCIIEIVCVKMLHDLYTNYFYRDRNS